MAVNLMEKGESCRLECDAKYCQPKDGQSSNITKEGKIFYHITLLGKFLMYCSGQFGGKMAAC